MYNEGQKNRFISEYTRSSKTSKLIVQTFNLFEKYEEDWGIDLSMQSTEKLQPVVNKLTGVREKSTELILIILREYVKWCEKNGYEVSQGIFDVSIDSIEKIKDQMVSTPHDLKERLNKYFEPVEKETIDIVYRVFLWMAFAGLDDIDAIRVSSDNIDLDNLVINFEGHTYELYKEGKDDFEKACKLTDFSYEHTTPDYKIRRDRAQGNIIMRGIRSPSVDLKTIRPAINKKFASESGGKEEKRTMLSYNRIYLSGIFYRADKRERAGLPVNFSEVVACEIKRKQRTKQYTTSKTRTLKTISNKIEREYLADYERWKCAFNK